MCTILENGLDLLVNHYASLETYGFLMCILKISDQCALYAFKLLSIPATTSTRDIFIKK